MNHVQDFTGQVALIGFFCNIAHLSHQKNAESRGCRKFFCSYKKTVNLVF